MVQQRRWQEIWKAAGAFDIDTFDLEERILSQMLYSTDYIADIEEIYESYVKGGGRELICMAYLSYFADAWLVRNMVVPEYVFEQIFAVIRKEILSTMRVNWGC